MLTSDRYSTIFRGARRAQGVPGPPLVFANPNQPAV